MPVGFKIPVTLMVGIPRGGYIIAVYLSHYFDLTWMDFENFRKFQKYSNKESVLIVDDIADTGNTLKGFNKFDCATLYYKPRSIVRPTYYIEEFKNSIIIKENIINVFFKMLKC